jgi:hypothetical protein
MDSRQILKKILLAIFSIMFWIFLIYQVKTALGIDLFENKSVWDALDEPFYNSFEDGYFLFHKNK